MTLSPHPTLVNVVQSYKNRKYPVRLQHIFFGGGGREVFLTASALKRFVLKLDFMLAMSTFLDIFFSLTFFFSGTQCISL